MIELNKDRDTQDGNGIKTSFDFDFYIQKNTDIKIYIINKITGVKTLKTLTTDYSVSNIKNTGFTTTMLVAPTDNEQIFVLRDVPYTQGLNIEAVTDFDERKLMGALDKLTAMCQQLKGALDRTIQTADESDVIGLSIPSVLTPGSAIKINATGDGVELTDTDIDEAIAVADAAVISTTANATAALASANSAAEYARAVQVTGVLDKDNWTLVSGLYEYDLADTNISVNSVVDIVPDNGDIAVVRAALILPKTVSSAGSVKVYATNEPTDDIGVSLVIWGVST